MERVKWIDYLKGFAIVLMVIGHYQGTPAFLNIWIYAFHMPLFFFLSGYLSENISNRGGYLLRRFKALMIPYYSFGILMLIMDALLNSSRNLLHEALNIVYYIWRPAMWFFFVLYLSCVAYYFSFRLPQKKKVFLLFICYFGSLLSSFYDIKLPFRLEIVSSAFCFFLLGDILRSKVRKLLSLSFKKKAFIGLLTLITFTYSALQFPRIDLLLNVLHPVYGVIALLGILSFVILFNVLSDVYSLNYLQYISVNSIIILVFHSKIFWFSNMVLQKLNLMDNIEINIIFTLFVEVLFLVPAIYLFNNYFFFFLGKSSKIVHTM